MLYRCGNCEGTGKIPVGDEFDSWKEDCLDCKGVGSFADRRSKIELVSEEHVREYLSEYFEFGKEGMANLDEVIDVLKGAGCIFCERKELPCTKN